MREQLELTVAGRVADAVLRTIRDRFDDVVVRAQPGPTTVLTVPGLDQSGERALLTLLWDTGHVIQSLSSPPPTRTEPEG